MQLRVDEASKRRLAEAANETRISVTAFVLQYALRAPTMTAIDRSTGLTPLAKGAPVQVSALLTGRLATNQCAAGDGLGTQMAAHVLAIGADHPSGSETEPAAIRRRQHGA